MSEIGLRFPFLSNWLAQNVCSFWIKGINIISNKYTNNLESTNEHLMAKGLHRERIATEV